MDLDVIWKVITGIVGGVIAVVLAAWKLSRTWTRMEEGQSASRAILDRIEDTVHGGPDRKNGLREVCGKIVVHTEQMDKRLSTVERRLNGYDRRSKPRGTADRRRKAS